MADTVFGFGFRIFAKNRAKKPTEDAARSMEKLAKKVKRTGTEAKQAQPHMKGLNKGMGKGSKAAGKMKRAIVGLVAAIGAFMIVRKSVGIMKSFVGQGIETEDQILILRSITGDTAKAFEAYNWAVKKAAETPFEISDIIESFTQLSAYGFDAKNTLDLVGNMALSMGKSIEEATQSLALAAMGERKSLRQQFAVDSADIEKWTAGMTAGTQKYKVALVEGLQSVQRFQGGMERAQNTSSVMISNIIDWWARMKMAVAGKPGEGLLADSWKGFLKNILTRLEKMEEKATKLMINLGKVLGRVVSMVSSVVGTAFNWMERWINKTGEAFEAQKAGIYPFILWLTLAFGKVKGFFQDFMVGWRRGSAAIAEVSQALDSLFMKDFKAPDAEGWGNFAEALGQVASGLTAIGVAMEMVGKAFEGWKWIMEGAGKGVDALAWLNLKMYDLETRGFDWTAGGIQSMRDTRPEFRPGEEGPFGKRQRVPSQFTIATPDWMNNRVDTAGSAGTTIHKSVGFGDINIKIDTLPGQVIDETVLAAQIIEQIKEQGEIEMNRVGE